MLDHINTTSEQSSMRSHTPHTDSFEKLAWRNSTMAFVALFIMLAISTMTSAQWVNHYPKVDDFGHQLYLEQHELPIHTFGITDPAPAPDGKTIAIASKGWIWLFNLETGVAKRFTDSGAVDSRPRWSVNGKRLTFVRDFGNDTAVVIKELDSGKETVINSTAIDIDPEFSADGQYLYYTSGISGSLNLYQREIASGTQQEISNLKQVERNARRLSDQQGIVYLHGDGAHRVLRHRNFLKGTDEIIKAQTLTYHLTSDVHPTRDLLVFSAPIDNDYHLWTMDMSDQRVAKKLTTGTSFALTPAFSADGDQIYYVQLSDNRQFQLMRMSTYGSKPEEVRVTTWEYGAPSGQLDIAIFDEQQSPVVARISIVSATGHPVSNPKGATFVDPQTGRTYFYADKSTSLTLPIGEYQVLAARGPLKNIVSRTLKVKKSKTEKLEIVLAPLWDSNKAGYYSADFHGHLNGDGHQRATHEDALLQMQGEDLNMLSPMSWNRWERLIDSGIVGKRTTQEAYTVVQGQEVRSHFHGHIGLLNVTEPFTPWFFGPNNPTLGDPDLTNADVFAYANKVGAFATYVHSVGDDEDPFSAEGNINGIPLELVSDGVLEPKMGLELVCAWTSPLGTSELWYRLLNIGQPVIAMSGTDTWIDFHRTPAVGTGRAYVRPLNDNSSSDPIIAGALAGRSFLTTGPMIRFSLDNGAKPGDVSDSGKQAYTLTLASTVAMEKVEIIVNGKVVQTLAGINRGETKDYQGQVELPEGGWVAARAYASEQRADSWPSMHARPFAHSSPIWIKQIGSTTKEDKAKAADDLVRAIDAAEIRAKKAYGEKPMPRLYERFEDARSALLNMQ